MRTLALILLITLYSCTQSQERKIVTELDYYPPQRESVSEDTYRKWTKMLGDTYQQVKEDGGEFVYADHINIASAFIRLREPKQKVLDQLYLAQEKDLESTAELFPLVYTYESFDGYLTEDEFDSLIQKFEKVLANKKDEVLDLKQYAAAGGYDYPLIKLLDWLEERDKRHRKGDEDWDKQTKLDQANILIIDSLFAVHQVYIGESIVGDEFDHTMWLIIQHSDLEHQEKYLPIVHAAVEAGELPRGPLKLLVDRVHKKNYGTQIFGSQSGGEMADDETIAEVKAKYGFR